MTEIFDFLLKQIHSVYSAANQNYLGVVIYSMKVRRTRCGQKKNAKALALSTDFVALLFLKFCALMRL
jgi:hypothetical protein